MLFNRQSIWIQLDTRLFNFFSTVSRQLPLFGNVSQVLVPQCIYRSAHVFLVLKSSYKICEYLDTGLFTREKVFECNSIHNLLIDYLNTNIVNRRLFKYNQVAHDMPGFSCSITHRKDGAHDTIGFRCRIIHRGEGDCIWDCPLSESYVH